MSHSLKALAVGLGGQFADHEEALRALDVELVGLVDAHEPAVRKWSERLGVPGFTSIDKLPASIKPDFALIAVPHDQYLPLVRTLARRGIHIFKEKPLARNIKEGRAIERIAQAAGIELMVAVQRRYNPFYAAFPDLASQIGQWRAVQGAYTINVDPSVGWRARKEIAGGGSLIDMGYHLIDLMIWYLGVPDGVLLLSHDGAHPGNYDVEDTAMLSVQYDHPHVVGHFVVSRCMAPKLETLTIIGTEGSVTLTRGQVHHGDLLVKTEDLVLYDNNGDSLQRVSAQELIQDRPNAHNCQLEHFLRVLRGEAENFGSPRHHLEHMAVIEAAYMSNSGRTIRMINPKRFLKP